MEKLSYGVLRERLAEAREVVPEYTQWRHYKGGEYIVKMVAIREAEQDVVVIYSPMDHLDIPMSRPFNEWSDEVEWDGQNVTRFSLID